MVEPICLNNLLLLVPTAVGLAYETEHTIDQLTAAGAQKCRSDGNSCVAMHRCRMAELAQRRLATNSELQFVLWLDGDMVVEVDTVARLVDLVRTIAESIQVPDDAPPPQTRVALIGPNHAKWIWRREHTPAISGAYVKRNDPGSMAARCVVPPVAPLTLVNDESEECWVLPAVVAGMGALCQTREAFLAHCVEAPQISNAKGDGFPAITGAGPALDATGEWAWGSEDWTYSSWEWQCRRGVYLATHLRFGHVRKSVAWPGEQTVLEGVGV